MEIKCSLWLKEVIKFLVKLLKELVLLKIIKNFFKITIYEGEDKLIQNNKELVYCLLIILEKPKNGEVFANISFILDNKYCLKIVLEEENRNNLRVLEIEIEKV